MKGLRGNVRQLRKNPPLWQVYFGGNHDRFFTQRDLNGNPLRTEQDAINLLKAINRKNYKPLPSVDHTNDFGRLALKWVEKSECEIEWKEKRERIVRNLFIPYFGSKTDILTINDDRILKFQRHLKEKGLAQKTVKNYMLELKGFFNTQRKLIPQDKFPEFPKIRKIQPKPHEWLTEEELNQVFEFLSPHNIPIFTFLRYSACRPNEAGGLLKKHVDLKKMEFSFVTALGKGRRIKDTKTREAPTPFELIEPLFEVIKPLMDKPGEFVFYTKNENPYTTTRLERIWNTANKKANETYGIQKVSVYKLKHSFVYNRLDEGFDLDEIQSVTRHEGPESVKIYGNYSKRRKGRVMRGSHSVHTSENGEKPNEIKKKWSGREDLNLRHLTPHASALPGCATPR